MSQWAMMDLSTLFWNTMRLARSGALFQVRSYYLLLVKIIGFQCPL